MRPPSEPIRVLVVAEHPPHGPGLGTVLSSADGIEVVGEAADGGEAVEQAEELLPDVAVIDVAMHKSGGIEVCRHIKQRVPSARVLMLTNSDDDEDDLFEAVRAGANGYLLKTATEDLATGIHAVFAGDSLLSPAMATKLLIEFNQLTRSAAPTPIPGLEPTHLTPRESLILQRVATGRLNGEIAADLVISENTVRNHIRNTLEKLQLHSRTLAATRALRHGLLTADD